MAREEFQLMPGARRSFEREVQADTRYLGVVAAFRDLERAQWRATIPVKPHQTTPLSIRRAFAATHPEVMRRFRSIVGAE